MPKRDPNMTAKPAPAPLARPGATLQLLPIEYRWEFTRRHPVYLTCWHKAHRFHAGELQDPAEALLGKAAVIYLAAIGVSGDPPPPSAGHDVLQFGQLGTAWREGAVAPASYRAMAGDLLASLPSATKHTLGQLLIESADTPDADLQRRFDLMLRLMTLPDKSLDAMPHRPVIGINIESPQRAIVEAVEALVTQWKKIAGVAEVRRREDVLPDYLRAWDLHEGWQGDHYDVEQEKTFRRVARELGIPSRTAASRYHAAFEILTGHPYSFAHWVRTFAAIKLVRYCGLRSLRRHKSPGTKRQPGSRRPVPVSAIEKPRKPGAIGLLEMQSTPQNPMEDVENFLDVTGLIQKGWSDKEIMAEMQFDDPAAGLDLIQQLRRRHDDPST